MARNNITRLLKLLFVLVGFIMPAWAVDPVQVVKDIPGMTAQAITVVDYPSPYNKKIAFVVTSGKLYLVNVTNPANPVINSQVDIPKNFASSQPDVSVYDGYAYLSLCQDGVWVVHVADPDHPRVEGTNNQLNAAYGNDVKGTTLFVAASTGLEGEMGGLKALDVTKKYLPTYQFYCDSFSSSPCDVILSDNYAYVASSWDGFVIVDIHDTSHMEKILQLDTTEQALGVTLNAVGDIAYLAEHNYGLRAYNINLGNPAQSTERFAVATGSAAYDVKVKGNYAFLACYNNGVKIIDCSLATPAVVNTIDCPGARDLAIDGNYLYVASHYTGLQIFDITDPATCASAAVGSFNEMGSPTFIVRDNRPGYENMVYCLEVSLPWSYNTDPDGRLYSLRAIDCLSTPPDPKYTVDTKDTVLFYKPVGNYTQRQTIHHFDMEQIGDRLYVTGPGIGIQAFDITNPSQITQGHVFSDPSWGYTSTASYGNYLYVAGWLGDMYGIKIFTDSNWWLSQVGLWTLPYGTLEYGYKNNVLRVAGNYLYVLIRGRGLRVYDLASNPAGPSQIGPEYTNLTTGNSLDVLGDIVYVADGDSGLRILRHNPDHTLTQLGSYDVPGGAYGVKVANASGQIIASVIDLDNKKTRFINVTVPSNPWEFGNHEGFGHAWDAEAAGNRTWVADTIGGMKILDCHVTVGELNEEFNGEEGETVGGGWVVGHAVPPSGGDPVPNASIQYAPSGTSARIQRLNPANDSKVYKLFAYTQANPHLHIKIDGVSDPSHRYEIKVADYNASPAQIISLITNNKSWRYDFDIKKELEDRGFSTSDRELNIEIWALRPPDGSSTVWVDVDSIQQTNWDLPAVSTDLMDHATPVVLGHFMINHRKAHSDPEIAWKGWKWDGLVKGWGNDDYEHNPAVLETDIASCYFPSNGVYDQTDQSYIDYFQQYMQMLELDGGIFNLGFSRENGAANGPDSWEYQSMNLYLEKILGENKNLGKLYYAIPMYEDKAHWKWITPHEGINPVDCSAKARDDLDRWLTLFLEKTYTHRDYGTRYVQYRIDGRPVVYIFCYEEEVDVNLDGTMEITRLPAEQLKQWKENWKNTHNGLEPILLTNKIGTNYPNQLETANCKYSDVFDGYFEWPEFFTPLQDEYDAVDPNANAKLQTHSLVQEKEHWGAKDYDTYYRVKNGEVKIVSSSAWPGFNDKGVRSWIQVGTGTPVPDPVRREIPRAYGPESAPTFTYDYHLERIKNSSYPIKQIVTFNDWQEGTNIEPADDFAYIYRSGGVAPVPPGPAADEARTILLRKTRNAVAAIKGVAPGTADINLPYWILKVKNGYPSDHPAQTAAAQADAAMKLGDYAGAEAIIHPYYNALYFTPTPTPTPQPGEFWNDGFEGPAGWPVARWLDETGDPDCNAQISHAGNGMAGVIVRTADSTWGKVLSNQLVCQVDAYPYVEIMVTDVSPNTSWKVGILELDTGSYWDVSPSISHAGHYTVNYQAQTGLTGLRSFKVVLVVEGSADSYIAADFVHITAMPATPTATPTTTVTFTVTPTPTITPTHTVTPTPTATPIPADVNYSTFLGGGGLDVVRDICVDASGNIYLVGMTQSANLPVVNAMDSTYGGGEDGFIVKLGPDGRTILYCTYFGGTSHDDIRGIAADDAGNIYIIGATWSDCVSGGFPITLGALDNTLGGERDAYVAKLGPDGALLYCSYLGGPNWDYGRCIAVEPGGNVVYVGGFTHGSFPVTPGAAQETFGGMGDGFVAKLNLATPAMVYATYLGGMYWEAASALAVRNGVVYVAGGSQSPDFPVTSGALDSVNNPPAANSGGDATFTKISADGTTFLYSTFFGPEENPGGTDFSDLEVDERGFVYLVGTTGENGCPVTGNAIQKTLAGGTDGLVVILNSDYSAVTYCSYFGGTGDDRMLDLAVGADKNIWVAGDTSSPAFTAGTVACGGKDLFAAGFDLHGQMIWDNRIGGQYDEGGSDRDVCIGFNASGGICLAGATQSWNYPITQNATQPTYASGTDVCVTFLDKPAEAYTPTYTPTLTPTPTPANAWIDDFTGGTPGSRPEGWYDASQDPNFNACIQYAAVDSYAVVTRTAGDVWGKVLTASVLCNVDTFPMVQVVVSKVSPDTTWKVGIQQKTSPYTYWDLNTSSMEAGTFAWNFKERTGWSGWQNFSVVIVVEGGAASNIELGLVRVTRPVATPTCTATPTATRTATPAAANAYFTQFDGPAGEQPEGWMDETQDAGFQLRMLYIPDSKVGFTRTGGSWGKALSQVITCDVNVQSWVEIRVAAIHQFAGWKIGIQEEGGAWQYWDCNATQNSTGTFKYNLQTVTGWTGVHSFRIQITVEGVGGTYMNADWLRVGGEETVLAAACIPHHTGETVTSTATPTQTPAPTQVPLTLTPTPTQTQTATTTPWLQKNEVLAYPNPARGTVNFAFTLAGTGKVTIDIYKITGERVARIEERVDGGQGQTLRAAWNAANVAPGIYLYRFVIRDTAGNEMFKKVKKVAVIK